jgi:uncharacterized membrane protein YhhN
VSATAEWKTRDDRKVLALGVARDSGRPLALILIGLGMVAALFDWRAVLRDDKRAEYLLKPLTVAFLVTAAIALRHGNDESRWVFTITALALSGLGDVFLMLRRQRFRAGLTCFLFAHLAYVAAFRTLEFDLKGVITLPVVLGVGGVVYLRLWRGMVAGRDTDFAVPVGVYFLAIAAMGTSAILTAVRADWDAAHAALAIAGALLFMTSDTLIGWTRFVRDLPHGELAIIVTYHVAQVLLLLALLG